MLEESKREKITWERWRGWQTALPGAEDKLTQCQNLGPGGQLCTRPKRSLVQTLTKPYGLLGADKLYWVANRKLYMDGAEVTGLTLSSLKERKMVRFGDYLLIWPDRMAVNVYYPDQRFPMELLYGSTLEVGCCDRAGVALAVVEALPQEGSEGQKAVLDGRLYVMENGLWKEQEEAVWCFVRGTGLQDSFQVGDGVEVTMAGQVLGAGLVEKVETDRLVLSGLVPAPQSGSGTVCRSTPDLDWVVSCGDRVYGCKFVAGQGNTLYACAKGNVRNWLVGDAWQSERTEPGRWTGATELLGCPVFMKEQSVLRIYPQEDGDHRVDVMNAPGAARGCEKSLAVDQGKVYYLSGQGLRMYDGGFPEEIGGETGPWEQGVAVCAGGEYILSAKDADQQSHLLRYDLQEKAWRREDSLEAKWMATVQGRPYALTPEGQLWCLDGGEGTPEGDFDYRFVLPQVCLEEGQSLWAVEVDCQTSGSMTVAVAFDGQSQPVTVGTVTSFTRRKLYVPWRRAHHFQVVLEGTGSCRVHSIGYIVREV